MQPCKSKGLNWPFLRFSGGLFWMQRGIPAIARSGGNTDWAYRKIWFKNSHSYINNIAFVEFERIFLCNFTRSFGRSGILLFPDRPRFCRLMKTRNLRYPRSSGMNGDKSGELGVLNGPIQFESARKIWPLLELLEKIRWVLAKIFQVLACSDFR